MVSKLQFIQINSHNIAAAAIAFCKRMTMERIEISLDLNQPTYRGRISGLNISQGQLHSTNQGPESHKGCEGDIFE